MDTISVLDLIPQRPPFVMINSLLYADKSKANTVFQILKENLFIDKEGNFSEAGIIENIAQTCAAHIGYMNRSQAMKIGVIGAVKNLEIYKLPKYNQTIETSIEVTNIVFDTTIVQAKVMCNETLIAACEMKVSITEKTIV
ncbi:MAG: pseudouridylate synthase [Bacteroidales bacterium]|jgi:predicted hotdog family 3-hydroxylacyl-ACP dehydratase|nr:pseudouridylate synthase [Bacteroidales bacterium]